MFGHLPIPQHFAREREVVTEEEIKLKLCNKAQEFTDENQPCVPACRAQGHSVPVMEVSAVVEGIVEFISLSQNGGLKTRKDGSPSCRENPQRYTFRMGEACGWERPWASPGPSAFPCCPT